MSCLYAHHAQDMHSIVEVCTLIYAKIIFPYLMARGPHCIIKYKMNHIMKFMNYISQNHELL